MHEFSIVSSLMIAIEEQARLHGASAVTKVVLSVGRFSGIEPDLLKLAFDTFKEGTICQNAELVIEMEDLELLCRACGARSRHQKPTRRCPSCGSTDTEIVGGKDLLLKSLELETEGME